MVSYLPITSKANVVDSNSLPHNHEATPSTLKEKILIAQNRMKQ